MNAISIQVGQRQLARLQDSFVAILHRIETHVRICFRNVRCRQRRADCEAEAVALCWHWFCRLAQQGKDAQEFVSTLVTYAVRSVRSGRRLCGQLKTGDVLNEHAQREHGFRVESLPTSTRQSFEKVYCTVGGQRRINAFEERLQDNMQTPILDQVVFRCDFPEWLDSQSIRDRHLIRDMACDERTSDLAEKYKMSPGRISQLRREFHDDWQRFCDEPELVSTEEQTPHAAGRE